MENYLEMCLRFDGKEDMYLRIPTVWDAVGNQHIAFIQTPNSKIVIHATGKDSFELQNNMNVAMSKRMHESEELAKEILSMFMPAFYWDKN